MKTALKLTLLASATLLSADLLAMAALVDRTVNGELQIVWEAPAGAPVDVWLYYGRDGEQTKQLISEDDKDGRHVQAIGAERPYVILRDDTGHEFRVAERLLPLEGGRNFRDLGGYATTDGRHVKWGVLYRSGSMVDLTAEDYDFLDTLDIAVVCDFRSTEERQTEPTRWHTDPQPVRIERDYVLNMSFAADMMNNPDLTPDEAQQLFAEFYREVPFIYAEHYRDMFAQLVAGHYPLAFNCSAGKDRTGVGAALLLTALGVPRDEVIADYQLTNKYFTLVMPKEGEDTATSRMLAALSPEIVQVMGGAEAANLHAVFAELEERYGSVESYLEQELGVDAAALAKLQELYTE